MGLAASPRLILWRRGPKMSLRKLGQVPASDLDEDLLVYSGAPAQGEGHLGFPKIFNSVAKVPVTRGSNQLVGTYQATIPAQSAWQHSVDPAQHAAAEAKIAWRGIYEENYSVARRFLLSMGVPGDAIEDACQDVFLQAFRYLPKFRGDCSFKTWLYRICASEARRHRQRTRKRRSLLSLLTIESHSPVAQGELGERRAERLVNQALGQLSETERLVFVLYEFEGLVGKEISEIAQCPEATVWRRLHYARKNFRDSFTKHAEDT